MLLHKNGGTLTLGQDDDHDYVLKAKRCLPRGPSPPLLFMMVMIPNINYGRIYVTMVRCLPYLSPSVNHLQGTFLKLV